MQQAFERILQVQYKNRSLLDHFCDIYYQIQEDKYYNAKELNDFEDLSHFIKEQRFTYTPLLTAEQVNHLPEQKFPWQDFRIKLMQLLNDKSQVKETILSYFPRQNDILNQCGYGFSQIDAYNIHKAVKKLASLNEFTQIRFWGKILAQNADYYVVEAQLHNPLSEPMPADTDDRVHELVHYVTQDILSDWILLPLVTREQLETSRSLTCVFSGDLNRIINSQPKFNGKEKHLLKCQILRISHSNLIVPRGLYKPNDDDAKAILFEEEFKMPEITELITTDAWVHLPSNLLKMGRITHYVDPSIPEADRQTILDQLATDDPEVERLRSIKDDKPFLPYVEDSNWLIKVMGEQQPFTSLEEGVMSYQTVLLRNYLWPGAVTCSNAQEFVSIYVGYGLKNQNQSFHPIAPKDLQDDPEDIVEFPEPNPQTQAEELEPDSDDERRRQQELLEQQQQE